MNENVEIFAGMRKKEYFCNIIMTKVEPEFTV